MLDNCFEDGRDQISIFVAAAAAYRVAVFAQHIVHKSHGALFDAGHRILATGALALLLGNQTLQLLQLLGLGCRQGCNANNEKEQFGHFVCVCLCAYCAFGDLLLLLVSTLR